MSTREDVRGWPISRWLGCLDTVQAPPKTPFKSIPHVDSWYTVSNAQRYHGPLLCPLLGSAAWCSLGGAGGVAVEKGVGGPPGGSLVKGRVPRHKQIGPKKLRLVSTKRPQQPKNAGLFQFWQQVFVLKKG